MTEGFYRSAFGVCGWTFLFRFLGTEMIAVTSGEVKDPDVAVPKALKATVFRLTTFYVLTIGIMLQFGIP
ncbi:hypothetical protein KZ287_27195 [Escherichia coli]|nr:hypothetical protein [Escherichia coli]